MIDFLLIVLFLTGLVLAGYSKGRERSATEIELLRIQLASLEAAQRISLKAWETARAMEALARAPLSRPALPTQSRQLPPK